MKKTKPRPKTMDDICSKHNRKLKDFEIFNGGCYLCKQEENNSPGRSTTIQVLPPEQSKQLFT